MASRLACLRLLGKVPGSLVRVQGDRCFSLTRRDVGRAKVGHRLHRGIERTLSVGYGAGGSLLVGAACVAM